MDGWENALAFALGILFGVIGTVVMAALCNQPKDDDEGGWPDNVTHLQRPR